MKRFSLCLMALMLTLAWAGPSEADNYYKRGHQGGHGYNGGHGYYPRRYPRYYAPRYYGGGYNDNYYWGALALYGAPIVLNAGHVPFAVETVRSTAPG